MRFKPRLRASRQPSGGLEWAAHVEDFGGIPGGDFAGVHFIKSTLHPPTGQVVDTYWFHQGDVFGKGPKAYAGAQMFQKIVARRLAKEKTGPKPVPPGFIVRVLGDAYESMGADRRLSFEEKVISLNAGLVHVYRGGGRPTKVQVQWVNLGGEPPVLVKLRSSRGRTKVLNATAGHASPFLNTPSAPPSDFLHSPRSIFLGPDDKLFFSSDGIAGHFAKPTYIRDSAGSEGPYIHPLVLLANRLGNRPANEFVDAFKVEQKKRAEQVFDDASILVIGHSRLRPRGPRRV